MAADRKPRPLSDGMVTILRTLAAGKPLHTVWASGRSHQGGLTTAMHALYKRGLITSDHKLTDAGRAAAGVTTAPAFSTAQVRAMADECGVSGTVQALYRFAVAAAAAGVAPCAPREITPEMMTEAAKRVDFDPVPGKLIILAGVLNAMRADGVEGKTNG